MKKWILRIVIGVVVLAVVIIGVTWLMLDSLVKKGVQHGGQYALGVPTEVRDVNLSLVNGTLKMDQLKVGNPEGFKSPHVMQSGKFDLEVRPGSVVNGPVEVKKFILDGLDINIEQAGGKNNISAVLNHVKQLGGGPSADKKPPKEQTEGTKIRVGTLVVKNVVAHLHLGIGGASKDLKIELPSIEMTDVTKDAPDGVTIGQLVMRIVPALLASVIEKGKGILPADLSAVLKTDVAGAAQALGGQASKLVEQVGGDVAAAVKDLDKTLKDAGGKIKDVEGTIKDGLKGLPKPKIP